MTTRADAFNYLESEVHGPRVRGLDRLRLVPAPYAPELRLFLAEDAIVWWARMEAEAGSRMAAPFWATAWPGGQGLARYLLDHRSSVEGRTVLDLASGSGLVAIAAALAGAGSVTANDIDPYALAAITLNARANDVTVGIRPGDLLDGDGGEAEVVLVGDVFYHETFAQRVWPFLQRAAARGADVLIGDPGRQYLPDTGLTTLATYPVPSAATSTEPHVTQLRVLRLTPERM